MRGRRFTFVSMSFFFSGHQKILALVSIFVLPEWPKCKISSNLLLRSIGTTNWSSTNTRPHRIDSFSNTGLYPSGAVSQSSRLMLVLTRVNSGSIAVFKISVFKSSINSNSAFLILSSVIFLFAVRFPTMWLICMYLASLLSVLYLDRFTIGKLSPRIIMLSSSVSSSSCSISPSSGLYSVSSGSGW